MSTITTDSTGVSGTNQNLSPYYALAYIMKVAPGTIVVPPVPPSTYSVIPTASSVNENALASFSVSTTNVPNGTTLYWTINHDTTSNADFPGSSGGGSFIINTNSGTFTVTIGDDKLTEGAETFTVSVRTGSLSGSVVATSSLVTINDTSKTPVIYWFARLFKTNNNYGGSVVLDSSNNVYMTAGYDDPSRYSTGGLVKFNNTGSIQFQKKIFTPGPYASSKISLGSIQKDSTNNLYQTGSNQYDALIIKYNSSGIPQWQKGIRHTGYPSNIWEIAYNKVVVDSSNNIYVHSRTTQVPLAVNSNAPPYTIIVKYNSAGVLQWKKDFNIVEIDQYGNNPRTILIDNSSNIYAVCQSGIAKFNSVGTLQWAKSITYTHPSGWSQYIIENATIDSFGNIYIVAQASWYTTAAYLLKLDSNLNVIWHTALLGSGYLSFGTLNLRDNSIFITGSVQTDKIDPARSNHYAAGIYKYDLNGNLLWQRFLGAHNVSNSTSWINFYISGAPAIDPDGDIFISANLYEFVSGDIEGYPVLAKLPGNGSGTGNTSNFKYVFGDASISTPSGTISILSASTVSQNFGLAETTPTNITFDPGDFTPTTITFTI
jgi:hypothetical protein